MRACLRRTYRRAETAFLKKHMTTPDDLAALSRLLDRLKQEQSDGDDPSATSLQRDLAREADALIPVIERVLSKPRVTLAWRTCAEHLRIFAIAYRSHPLRNPADTLEKALRYYNALVKEDK